MEKKKWISYRIILVHFVRDFVHGLSNFVEQSHDACSTQSRCVGRSRQFFVCGDK